MLRHRKERDKDREEGRKEGREGGREEREKKRVFSNMATEKHHCRKPSLYKVMYSESQTFFHISFRNTKLGYCSVPYQNFPGRLFYDSLVET